MRLVVTVLVASLAIPAAPASAQTPTGVIAYTRDADGPTGPAEPTIYVARLDGSDERALATGFAPNLPWNDSQLAYSVRAGGAAQQYVQDLFRGSAPRAVTTFGNREPEFGPGRYGAFGSVWSRSRTRLALRLTEGSTTTLAVVGADGSGFRRFEFGHLFGIAWRNDDEVAVGTETGPHIVDVNGTVTDPPGRKQTDTPVEWLDTDRLVVNAESGIEILDVTTGARTHAMDAATAWDVTTFGEIVYTTDKEVGALSRTDQTPKPYAALPEGAQVRTVLADRDQAIVELADATGNDTAIYATGGGTLRKIATGDNVTYSRATSYDRVPFDAATPTSLPAATAVPSVNGGTTTDVNEAADPAVAARAQGRSVVTAAVPAASSVETGVGALLASLLLTALLMLLLTFPAELFNKTLEEHYDEVRGWFRLKPRPPLASQPRGRRLAAFAISTLVAALLYSLLDPEFGFDGTSLRLYVGLLVGMVVVTAAFSAAPLVYLRRTYGERGLLRAFPGALGIGAACVLVSRLVSFEPGYLYGILGGFAFSRAFSKDEEGRNALVAAGSVLAVSVIAWLVWQPINDAAADGSPGLLLGLGDSTLATVALGGLQGLVIGLLPLRSLHGYALSRWNRRAWAALYGVVLFLFVHLLLREGGDETGPPFFLWFSLFAAFGAVSVAFWAWFRYGPSSGRTAPQ